MGSGAATSVYTARLLAPDHLERGRANALSCPVYQDGALVAPTEAGSTVSIYDASGTAKVDGAAVTVTASIATYSYNPAATLTLEEGWRVEWSLVISGTTHVFRNDAALVRKVLYPVVTDADLFRRVSALDPNGNSPISSLTDYQDYLDEAWATLQLRLLGRGSRPYLVMNPSAMREPHLLLTLALIFDDFATRLNQTYAERAAEYRRQFELAWGDLRFVYDEDDDGEADSQHRRAGQPVYWLTGRH